MAWSDPSSRSTGDLITAAIWNQDVVDNVQKAHDLAEVAVVECPFSAGSKQDRFPADSVGSGNESYASLSVPSDYSSVQKAVILFEPDATETIQFDINVYIAADGEDSATHTSSGSNLTASATANQLLEYDVSSYLASLAGSDHIAIRLTSDINNNYPVKFYMEYIRA